MHLAKDRLDIGLLTDDPGMIAFMSDEVGLGRPEVLPISRSVRQHRFDVDGSVVKVNVADRLTADDRSGYRAVVIADARAEQTRTLVGPDEVRVEVVPPGHDGVHQLGITLAVPDLDEAVRHYGPGLDWEVATVGSDRATVALGATRLLLIADDRAPTAVPPLTRGWTYATVQVHDCDTETARAVAAGARLVQEPTTLGTVARFSMIADPWGNQLEISQRASLTGPLPEEPPGAEHI